MPFQCFFLHSKYSQKSCIKEIAMYKRRDVTACCSLSGRYEDVWISGLWQRPGGGGCAVLRCTVPDTHNSRSNASILVTANKENIHRVVM